MGRLRSRVRRVAGPRSYQYVVVVTYGRSGSTLVQGLLNALPRTLVRGENNFYLVDLYRALTSVEDFQALHLQHNPRASHSAFYGLHEITADSFEASVRALVTGHLVGSVPPGEIDVLGFKEVLWHRVERDETERFFDFFEAIFPGCRFVLNERSLDQVVDSGFWQNQERDEVYAAIHRVEEIQNYLRSRYETRVLNLRYEALTSKDQATSDAWLRTLAEFVHSSCDDATLTNLRQTLATGHGPFPFGASRGRRERLEQRRQVR